MVTEKSTETLPKTMPLPGSVCAQYRKINGKTYGPYYFRFWRENGHLRKAYVPRSDVHATVEACALWYVRKIDGNRENIRIRLRSYKALFASLPGKLSWEIERDEARKARRRVQWRRARTPILVAQTSPLRGREEADALMKAVMDHLASLYGAR